MTIRLQVFRQAGDSASRLSWCVIAKSSGVPAQIFRGALLTTFEERRISDTFGCMDGGAAAHDERIRARGGENPWWTGGRWQRYGV